MLRRRAHRDRIIVKEKDKQRRIKDSHHKESEVADVKHVVEKRVEGSSHSGGVGMVRPFCITAVIDAVLESRKVSVISFLRFPESKDRK